MALHNYGKLISAFLQSFRSPRVEKYQYFSVFSSTAFPSAFPPQILTFVGNCVIILPVKGCDEDTRKSKILREEAVR